MLNALRASSTLKTATVRDFSGGWNVLDDDLNLATNYSVDAENIGYDIDGTMAVRYGTQLFVNASLALSSTGTLINAFYYGSAFVCVFSNGEIIRVYGDKTLERIWDASIAAALPGAPSGWSTTSFVSFAIFNGELIICNGVDKPLKIETDYTVDYLQDPATGSNLNVPICRYVVACNRFLVMAGDPVDPNRVHISSRDTSGVWYGDADPNNGTYVDIGSVVPEATIIRGIVPFRDRLIVTYAEGSIIGQLGIFDADGNHTPNFDDGVPQYGGVSHRALVSYGDDVLLLDGVGAASLQRTVFTGTIRPERTSDLIDPPMTAMMAALSFGSLEDRIFSVYDQRAGKFMFFIPNADTAAATTETRAFVFTYRPSLKVSSWAYYTGWNWTCAFRTSQNNVFFGRADGSIYLYGNPENEFEADFLDDVAVNNGEGAPINFTWEMPWLDFGRRAKSKTTKYISFDTRGTARFTCDMFADRIMVDRDLLPIPALSMEFVGGDTHGYGQGQQPYGGGRSTSYERLIHWPCKFNIAKLKFSGQAVGGLRFVAITMHYNEGGIHR